MIPKLENRTYGYLGDNAVSVTATLNIYNDTIIVASTTITAQANMGSEGFISEINTQLMGQISAYLTKLGELDVLRKQHFPESIDFEDAVNQIFDPIQTVIGG